MANPETEMIFTPSLVYGGQVAQLLNYGESKVRMLIITGQLRSIKEGDLAGFFQSGLRPMFKIAPSQPRTSGDESKSHSDSDPLYAAYVLVLVLGLRKGEVLGLAWEAVNFEQGTLVPDHQLQRVRRSPLYRAGYPCPT
jgi:hypothetical protein